MVQVGPLSGEQRQTLERLRRRAVGRVSQRAHLVRLNARGYTVRQIAASFEVGEDVVRTWLHRYQQEGAGGLDACPRPGRPPKERLARPIVDAQMSNPPPNSGLVPTCWTVGLLATFLATRFRLALSPSSVRRHLKAAGGRWARPRRAPATHAPHGQRKVDPEAPRKLKRLERGLASAATVLFLDECELQLLPVIRACWMTGPRWRVPTPGQNATRALFGALHARTGRLHYRVQPRKRALAFVAFLDQLALAYPVGPVHLVLDHVVTPDAKLVRQWRARPAHARFQFIWLPKYTAHEHNPIERVWGVLKTAVAANHLHGSLDAVVAAADRYLTQTHFRAPFPLASDVPALQAAA